MTQFKGTPGPWVVVDDDHHDLGTESSVLIESASRGITIAIVGPSGESPTYTEDIINANLIAAAPELLEALQHCVEWLDIHAPAGSAESFCVDEARAAINKALGGE